MEAAFGRADYVDAGIEGETGFVTSVMTEAEFKAKAAALDVRSVIRLGNR